MWLKRLQTVTTTYNIKLAKKHISSIFRMIEEDYEVRLARILAPIMASMLLMALTSLPMFFLGFSLEFWDQNMYNIALIAIVFLGPYFVEEQWEEIKELSSKVKPSQPKE